MIGSSLNSKYILVDTVSPTDVASAQFGQNIQWVGSDLFAVTSDISSPILSDQLIFVDGAYFDGGFTNFFDTSSTASQKIDIFQVLKTKRDWINASTDILKPVAVTSIPIVGDNEVNAVYSGAIDNLFIGDAGNPNESIKIFNNPNMTHGWAAFTAQQSQLDSGSIKRAWIYDSVTKIKLSDLEVVDLIGGILPGTIASELDYISDIDPASYNIPSWLPSKLYNVGDRVSFNGQIYQALYAGKSGTIFNASLWNLISSQPNFNIEGFSTWGEQQVGKTWFKTSKLKVINAQLGSLTERAQNWNQWFPNSAIEVFEWVNSATPPYLYQNSDSNGYVLDVNSPYTYNTSTKKYGFWVYGKNSIGPLHNQTTLSLINAVRNIANSGIPMITAIDTNAVAVWNINQFISSNSIILHIDYIKKSSDNLLHNEFALISNDGSKSWYHTAIYPKLVDSLSGVTSNNLLVPDYTLPSNQQTGILTNPMQSLFVDRTTAVQVYFTSVNQYLANLAIATSSVISALSIFDPLPTVGFNEQISDRTVLAGLDPNLFPENYRILITNDDTLNPSAWSIVSNNKGTWVIAQYQLFNLVNNWTYIDWISPANTGVAPTFVLNNIGELSSIAYSVGDIIQINDDGNGKKDIFKAVVNDIDPNVIELNPIYIQNGTIQFLPNLYDFLATGIGFDNQPFDSQPFDNDPYLPIRLITQILNDTILDGDAILNSAADNSFYAILKFIMFENRNLDWLFKTSFVSVEYDNRNLNVQGSYEPDNQSAIEDFISETTPYHVRVREFRDTYSVDDYGNIGAIDFDLPAQYDVNYANLVYDFAQNGKYNIGLPLSVFLDNVGVSGDINSCYIKSNGLPNTNNYLLSEDSNFLVNNQGISLQAYNWNFGIPKVPVTESIKYDTPTNPLGPIAVAIDGIPFFGPNSGNVETLYLSGNISQPLANVSTNATYTLNSVWSAINNNGDDPGLGYVNNYGQFQYASNPYALANSSVGTHSPIIGFAWDGNPIYGPYGYANSDGSGGIIVNTPSYQLSSTPRLDKTGQPIVNGLQMAIYATPTGQYIEDFVYTPNSGTLDECNGRFVVTPDYPTGTYAYFATVTSGNVSIPAYPYVLGLCYQSRPFGIKYEYINGVNTPVYVNGNVNISVAPYANVTNFNRTPDGSATSDLSTWQESIYAPWFNYHTYSISSLNVERAGAGFLDLTGNVIITPTNNASANIASLSLVSANLVSGGNNYLVGDIISLVGGTYSNAGNLQVTTVNVSNSNSIVTFSLLPTIDQGYISLPANVANVASYCLTSNGSGATFSVSFGIESIQVVNGGNNFSYTPNIVVHYSNAYIGATIYPILVNDTVRSFKTSLEFNRVNTVPYTGVIVNAGTFSGSYQVPNGSIFDSNDETAGITSLNISWRPELITNTALTTDLSRFGNSSGVFNASLNQYLTANISSPDITDIAIGASSFTIEFFVNFSNLSSAVMLDTRANASSSTGLVISYNNGNLCIGANTNVAIISTGAIPFTLNNWEYIVVQGNAGNLYSYLNGQLVGVANVSYNFSDSNLILGADVLGANILTGYMDELRITQSYNRYTPGIININVPSSEFPRSILLDPYLLSQYTPILYGFENLFNESKSVINFTPVNAETIIYDLSWNQKKLQLVNYGSNLVIDSTTINSDTNPQSSEILTAKLNQG